MNTTKVGYYILALLLLPLLAACSPAASQLPATAAETAAATEAPPTATSTPEPTATPTEIPDPEVSFEELASIDPSLGTFFQDEAGNIIYNSPLLNTEVGKNIPVVQQYREVGLDGGAEIWIAPEKYPNAPIFIQDLDTGEIRQGLFTYDKDVRRRLTVPASADYVRQDPFLRVFEGNVPLSGTIAEFSDSRVWDLYGLSLVLVSDPIEEDGHLTMGVKSYIGDEEDMLAFNFSLYLGNVGDIEDGPLTSTYRGNDKFSYSFRGLFQSHREHFRDRYSLYSQILVVGYSKIHNIDSIPEYSDYINNARYAYEHEDENNVVIDIIKSGGLLGDLVDEINYEDLFLYGPAILIFN